MKIRLCIKIPNIILLISFHLLVKTKSISAKNTILIFESRAKWSASG